jgi:hypothetical protein
VPPLQLIERVAPSGNVGSARDMRRHRKMQWAMLAEQPQEVLNRSELPERARQVAPAANVVAVVTQLDGQGRGGPELNGMGHLLNLPRARDLSRASQSGRFSSSGNKTTLSCSLGSVRAMTATQLSASLRL